MTDYQISKLVGLRTYCHLYNAAPHLYQERIECGKYEKDNLNEVTTYVADNIPMKSIKQDLQYCIKTGEKLESVKNLIGSSYSYEGIAWPRWFIIVWIILVLTVVSIIAYVLIMSGVIHNILYKNFTPGMVDVNFI